MPSKDPNANTSRGSNRGRGERPSDEKQTANMKSFLTGRNKKIGRASCRERV